MQTDQLSSSILKNNSILILQYRRSHFVKKLFLISSAEFNLKTSVWFLMLLITVISCFARNCGSSKFLPADLFTLDVSDATILYQLNARYQCVSRASNVRMRWYLKSGLHLNFEKDILFVVIFCTIRQKN